MNVINENRFSSQYKCGRLEFADLRIEFMTKVNYKKTIFYSITLISLFFLGMGVGLSQPPSKTENGPEIKLGEVTIKIREFESTPPLKILELQIEILNQSQQSVAPPNSIKVVVTPKEIKFSSIKSRSEFTPTPEETTLNLPISPRAGRVMIIGYPFLEESPESITFEVQINPPEGEKKTVTWEKR